ncbi:MAG: hypothetical protein M0Z42_10430 [Actinomycetota bacterium]|nr:hypothetical protein [Actinomycetota bacterium]
MTEQLPLVNGTSTARTTCTTPWAGGGRRSTACPAGDGATGRLSMAVERRG